MAITSEQQTEILKIVAGLFNAAPGNDFLPDMESFIDGGGDPRDLARALAAHTTFTDDVLGSATDTAAKVAILLDNFGLAAGGAEGSASAIAEEYFTGRIDAGDDFGDIIYDAVVYLSGSVPTEFAEVATLLSNKAAVAAYYSNTLNEGGTDLAALQDVLSEVTGTETYDEADIIAALEAAGIDVPADFTLTSAKDTVIMTTGNDSVEGASGTLGATDLIIDSTSTDSDTLTATITNYAAATTPTITKVETVNVNGEFTTTGLALTNVSGTTTLNLNTGITSGTATVIDAANTAAAKIVAGANVSTLSVTALAAGTGGTVTVDASKATTVTANGGAGADVFDLTVGAGSTAGLTIDGGAGTDDYVVNLGGGKLSLTNTTSGSVETLTLNSIGGAANTVTLTSATNVLVATSGTVKGDQNLTLVGDLDALTGLKIVQDSSFTGTFTVQSNAGATAAELNKIEADVVDFITADPNYGGVTLNNNSVAKLSVDTGGGATTWDAADSNGTVTTSLTFVVATNQTKIDLTNVATDVVKISGGSTAGTGVTITTLDTDASTATSQTIQLSGSEKITISTLTSDANSVLTASAMTAALTVSAVSAAATIIGGSGNDTVTGSTFADLLRGEGGNDTLATNGGADTVFGGAGDDSVTGGTGTDTLNGDDGADYLTGAAAADTISGGAGNDTIIGGAADDNLTGGAGNDIFTFENTGNGNDTITDFVHGTDKLDVSNTVAGATNTVTSLISGAANGVTLTDDAVYLTGFTGAAANLTTGGTATVTDFTVAAQVAAYLDERMNDNNNAGDVATFIINDSNGSSTTSYVWAYLDNGGTTAIDAAELTLVGTVTRDTILTSADIQV